jgi:hypothetical protein
VDRVLAHDLSINVDEFTPSGEFASNQET